MGAIAKGRSPEMVTAEMVQVWLRLLPEVPIKHVERAVELWSRDPEQRHPPTPGDVLGLIRAKTQGPWMGADEAWAVALTAADEGATVIWFDQMAEAWSAAQPVLEVGDEVGARMAFRDAYRRLVAVAQERGDKPKAWVSLGHDPDRREPALRKAVGAGLLTEAQALRHLPPPMTEGGAAIAGLLTGNVVAHPSLTSHLAALKAAIKPRSAKKQEVDEAEIQRRRNAARAMMEGAQ
jgi:hypothetical protein